MEPLADEVYYHEEGVGQDDEGGEPPAPPLLELVPLRISQRALSDARMREQRCYRAMRRANIIEILRICLPEQHVVCPVTMDGCALCRAAAGNEYDTHLCTHARSRFSSTANCKRRVHVLLFWKQMLGSNFPIVDSMLRDVVWRNLASCELGAKDSNGHAKSRGQGVCVNPAHYWPTNCAVMMDTLLEALQELGVAPGQGIMHVLQAVLRPCFESDRTYFLAACKYVTLVSSRIVPVVP